MSINISGSIVQIGETQTLGSKGFQKRAFVVKTDEKYPQELEIEATKDRIEALDDVRVGDSVNVSVNLRGRRWDGPKGTKFFVSLEAWKIESAGGQRSAGSASQPALSAAAPVDDSDIPFVTCDISLEPSSIAKVLR